MACAPAEFMVLEIGFWNKQVSGVGDGGNGTDKAVLFPGNPGVGKT